MTSRQNYLNRDVPLPFNSGETEPKFSTAKEKSSIIIEKKDESNAANKESSSPAEPSIVLSTSPIQVQLHILETAF